MNSNQQILSPKCKNNFDKIMNQNKDADQNEVESKFHWKLDQGKPLYAFNRFNLSTLSIDASNTYSDSYFIDILNILPNNQIYGLWCENARGKISYHLFISDENLNIRRIETAFNWAHTRTFVSCYYDDAIFNFGYDHHEHKSIAKKYLISENRWIRLTIRYLDDIDSCTGFNQKMIFIVGWTPTLITYDIILDSYCFIRPAEEICSLKIKILIKCCHKLYVLACLDKYNYHTYCCDDPFLEWNFVFRYKDNPLWPKFNYCVSQWVYFEGLLYYLRGSQLFQFDFKKFITKKLSLVQMK